MKGFIGFENLKISCIIGVLPEEKTKEQEIFVDLKVLADFSICVKTDSIKDTVDYVELSRVCVSVAQNNRYALLEKLAHDVTEKILSDFNVSYVWIKIKKPKALKEAEHTTVECEKRR